MSLNLKSIRDIMRNDQGVSGDAQRLEEIVMLLFLKKYNILDEIAEIQEEKYNALPSDFKWENWVPKDFVNQEQKEQFLKDNPNYKERTDENLLKFFNDMIATFKAMDVNENSHPLKKCLHDIFQSVNNYMKDANLFKQVLKEIDKQNFEDAKEQHYFGTIYEEMLRELQASGASGEFYTPRALTRFIVDRLNIKLGERFADFTAGTGGFLTAAIDALSKFEQKNTEDNDKFQNAVYGAELKPLPYLLCLTNMFIHEIKNPDIHNIDSLKLYHDDISEDKLFDCIGMNPPYGGVINKNSQTLSSFDEDERSSETADLFIMLIMKYLAKGGRAGVIIPDGFLFGDGNKARIKQHLLRDFNLHTIIRLPGSVFAPYTSIATNILFFDRPSVEKPIEQEYTTQETWFYRLDLVNNVKFSKTKPMQDSHCDIIKEWWSNRTEIINSENDIKAKKFTIDQLVSLNFNFDQCKYPKEEKIILPPDQLLAEYHKKRLELDQKIDNTLQQIEAILNQK